MSSKYRKPITELHGVICQKSGLEICFCDIVCSVGFKVDVASIFMLNKFGVDGIFFGISLISHVV